MARKGRPRGTGYDDADRIARVRRVMAVGATRRAAILATCGHDQLRRIEMKMRLADMSEALGKRVAQIIRAGLDGMGRGHGEVTVTLQRPSRYDAATLTAMEAEARRFGFTLVGRTEAPAPSV